MQGNKTDVRKQTIKRLSDYCILLFLSGYGEQKKGKLQKREGHRGLGAGGGCLL